MKKTKTIQLVLITAALAACNRPLYQQQPAGYEDPGYSSDGSSEVPGPGPGYGRGLNTDSTNSCPVESSDLPPDYYDWFNGLGAFGSFTVNFNITGFYAYRNPPPLVHVNPFHALFTRAFANFPGAVRNLPTVVHYVPAGAHPMSTSTRPGVARSGFGARMGAAVHS